MSGKHGGSNRIPFEIGLSAIEKEWSEPAFANQILSRVFDRDRMLYSDETFDWTLVTKYRPASLLKIYAEFGIEEGIGIIYKCILPT